MFWFVVDVLTLRRLGLGRPFRYAILVFLVGALIGGIIYASIIFHAAAERGNASHVQQHSRRH